jgi:transposase
MTRRTFRAVNIVEILIHWKAGRKKAEVARSLGVDRGTVAKYTAKALSEGYGPGGEVKVAKERFATTQAGLAELTAFLMDAGVSTVAMEATGIYWRPIYYALEGLFEELWLATPST